MKKTQTQSILSLLCFVFIVSSQSASAQSPNNFSTNQIEEITKEAIQSQSQARKLSLEWNRNSISAAIEIYIKTAETWKKLNNISNAAACLREIARFWLVLGDKQKSEQSLLSTLKILPKNEFNDEKAKVYSQLSLLFLEKGQINKSQSFFQKARNFAQKTNSPSAKAIALYSAGEFYYYRDDLINSRNYYQKALEQWQIAKDSQGEARTLLDLGYLFHLQGEFEQSLIYLNNALMKWKVASDLRGEAFTLKALGTLSKVTNEHQKALEFFHQAEQFFPNDMDFGEKASLYNWTGSVYEEYKDWNLSLNYRNKALHLFEKESHIYGQLATLPSLARLSHFSGNDETALEYLEKAENLARILNDKFYLATINEERSNIYYKRGEYQKAIVFYNKSLQLYPKKIYHKQIARIFNKLGQIYGKQNDFLFSRQYFLPALVLNRKVKDKFGEAETLYNLAKLNSLEEKYDVALQSVKNSIELTEHVSSMVLNSKLKSTYFSNVFDRYELYTSLLMKMHKQLPNENYAIQALQAAEKSRARSMLENLSLSEANFTKDADAETIKREKEIRVLLNIKADKLSDLLSQNGDKAKVEKLDNEINELNNELEELKGKLKQISPIYSAVKNPAPFDVAEFQKNVLDENSLLLEFSFGKEESYLWLVGKTEINSYVLPPREQIESHIEKLRELLASREMKQGESIENYQARISEADNNYKFESKQLSDKLFGQIADKLSNKRLIIVPDGKLHYFPIAALPFPNSTDNLPILLTNETVYEPSAATLALLMQKGKKTSDAPKNLLVFSDPIFSNQDARIATADIKDETRPETGSLQAEKFRFAESLTSLGRLNASQDEADAIVQIIGESESTALGGAAATRERALDASISDYKIIHFATHGLINEERPELSGIVLSQVDEAGQTRNGVVRLQDIYGMNLSADAVVLSACNTGIGKEVKGEGLLSLNNAFLQAGAKSVVSSLWKVDDYAAQELMKNFYRELTSGTVTTPEALRRAQIKMQQNPRYKSPFYWAAFKIEGNFQTAPKLSDGLGNWIYMSLIFPLLLLGMYVYYRKSKLLNNKIVING